MPPFSPPQATLLHISANDMAPHRHLTLFEGINPMNELSLGIFSHNHFQVKELHASWTFNNADEESCAGALSASAPIFLMDDGKKRGRILHCGKHYDVTQSGAQAPIFDKAEQVYLEAHLKLIGPRENLYKLIDSAEDHLETQIFLKNSAGLEICKYLSTQA